MNIDQTLAKSHMNHIHTTLHSCDIPFFLTEGTALGAIREQRVIPHDTDIDIGIDISYYDIFRSCALPIFKSLGFKIARDKDTFITIIKDYLYIDIMFMCENGNCISITCAEMREYDKIKVEMYGKQYWSLPIAYVEKIYGPNWKIPSRYKPPEL